MNIVNIDTWYAVQTQVNAEAKAARNLVRQGFEIYLPRYLKRRSHARKVEKVAAPLFPRYLFVRIDLGTQRWRSVQSTFGVSRLVCNGPDPAPVSQEVLSTLKSREDESGYIKLDQLPKLALGQKVRVLAGVFAENLGLFDGLADRDRVAILLDLLGRKVRVSIEADMVVAA
ncbi:transcription termination/antitermination protein NusG [Bradyrhizobium retamae]|uniref:Transcriptional regulator n=1 Tax=Bradyrhizobium retamae TaxID=1300035 RepID=A0A0R3MF89_9BRAD|nr:transcriptional activator RfaH [Bradyrhizobium retamae]KRR18508.1 transcriptional regulator [Bradyrhizobium retamae]